LEARVGVSITSIEAARKNLASENPSFDFSSIRKKAFKLWNDAVGKIKLRATKNTKHIFYTALYHTCFLPLTLTDVDGTYPGLDKKNHTAKSYIHYGDYAFWDSFRTKYPLYSLYQPGVYRDIAKSLRDLYEQGDWSKPYGTHEVHISGYKVAGKNDYQVYSSCRTNIC
jgi:putative alpha-1,2-mannosidase